MSLTEFKEDCYDIFYSFKEAIIRFFNNRFVTVDENMEFLKLELSKERLEKQKLQDYILEMHNPRPEPVGATEFEPIKARVPFHITRRKLEEDSRKRAQELKVNTEMASKSTEELEQELL